MIDHRESIFTFVLWNMCKTDPKAAHPYPKDRKAYERTLVPTPQAPPMDVAADDTFLVVIVCV